MSTMLIFNNHMVNFIFKKNFWYVENQYYNWSQFYFYKHNFHGMNTVTLSPRLNYAMLSMAYLSDVSKMYLNRSVIYMYNISGINNMS